MKTVGLTLDPSKFTVVRHVAIVDEFTMTNDDGSFVANVDESFLAKLVQHMNEREATTGDLCPVVIGHTQDGVMEVGQPPVVGYCRNWVLDDFFDTGRRAAFADLWIMNDEVERVRKYPRRSAEVWVTRYEADPLSLLGATTPARDLGLLKLNRAGSLTYDAPGELKMPDDKKPEPDDKSTKNPDAAGTKQILDAINQLSATVSQLVDKMGGGMDKPKDAEPKGGADDEISDAELEKLLAGDGNPEPMPEPDDKSRKGEPEPVKNNANCYPGGNDTVAKMARLESEHEQLLVKLALTDLFGQGFNQCDPKDDALVQDLSAMPREIRARSIERLKLSRAPGQQSHNLNAALNDPGPNPVPNDGKKRVTTVDENRQVMKLARDKNLTYTAAARELGFFIPE